MRDPHKSLEHFYRVVASRTHARPSSTEDALYEAVRLLEEHWVHDRDLLVRTAALVALGVTLRYPLGTSQEIAQKSVSLARAIVSAVDGEHDPAE